VNSLADIAFINVSIVQRHGPINSCRFLAQELTKIGTVLAGQMSGAAVVGVVGATGAWGATGTGAGFPASGAAGGAEAEGAEAEGAEAEGAEAEGAEAEGAGAAAGVCACAAALMSRRGMIRDKRMMRN
jgi:hypothetical protein